MQEPKIMALEEGKFYANDFSFKSVFKIEDGRLYEWHTEKEEWYTGKFDNEVIFHLINNQAIDFVLNQAGLREVKNPEKKEPEIKQNELNLLRPGAPLDNRLHILNFIGSKNENITNAWRKSLCTFMELKAHPLAVKPTLDHEERFEEQFYVGINIGENKIYPLDSDFNCDKSDYLSPMFDSLDDIRKAIYDIGEDNLLEMFKTFSGVYE